MILAAAAFADDPHVNAPPPELVAHWNMQTYQIPPRAGGQADQPAGLLSRMTAAANAYHSWREFTRAAHKIQWQQDHPEGWDTCKLIMRLRREHGEN
jgi:hypothetical protein